MASAPRSDRGKRGDAPRERHPHALIEQVRRDRAGRLGAELGERPERPETFDRTRIRAGR